MQKTNPKTRLHFLLCKKIFFIFFYLAWIIFLMCFVRFTSLLSCILVEMLNERTAITPTSGPVPGRCSSSSCFMRDLMTLKTSGCYCMFTYAQWQWCCLVSGRCCSSFPHLLYLNFLVPLQNAALIVVSSVPSTLEVFPGH